MPPQPTPLVDRFWSKIDIPDTADADACWPWNAAPSKQGYGRISDNKPCKRIRQATHIVWWLVYDEDPTGYTIAHTCDNPPCCNPFHLCKGTQADNIADMIRKGRNATGIRSGRTRHPDRYGVGVNHPRAKLTVVQVQAIRKSTGSCMQVATQFGSSPLTVSKIRRRIFYSSVPEDSDV